MENDCLSFGYITDPVFDWRSFLNWLMLLQTDLLQTNTQNSNNENIYAKRKSILRYSIKSPNDSKSVP